MKTNNSLTPTERLKMQQLLQADFWSGRTAPAASEGTELPSIEPIASVLPTLWSLTRGIDLHEWQHDCVDAWFRAAKKGVLKVVTGAGKTVLALAIAERLQHESEPDLRIAIVVPTVVLLTQWRDEIAARSNLPPEAIGLLGGGFDDSFNDEVRILICVLNSAAKKLPDLVRKANIGGSLLLIVDECHRAGAAEMRRIFETERTYSLGLSATPEREADISTDVDLNDSKFDEGFGPVDFDQSVIGQALGPVIFELSYADAIAQKILPPFKIAHYGLSLTTKERGVYDRISREVTSLRRDLERPGRRGLDLIRWCRSKAAANNPLATQLLTLTARRKRLLFQMEGRTKAAVKILKETLAENPSSRAILFHESIEQVMMLFMLLRAEGLPVVAEHSQFPDSLRAESLRLFKEGTAQIIVSARSLIEGFNVPSADVGIIVAASSSVRQRVQTLGRLLRKSRNSDGSEKHATLYVLYAADTVDELIYEKANWEEFVGAQRNSYFLWSDIDGSRPKEIAGPPRTPEPSEITIDSTLLQSGNTYTGNLDEGHEYTRDTQGTIRTVDGHLIEPHGELTSLLKNSHKVAGRFRITPVKNYVIELQKTDDEWRGVYLGTLTSKIRRVQPPGEKLEQKEWRPGDAYPLAHVSGKTFSVLQRDPRLIARKERGQTRFVIPIDRVSDSEKRESLQQVQGYLKTAYANGHRISRITVTKDGHVVYIFDNQAVFAGFAPEGAEGFIFEPETNS